MGYPLKGRNGGEVADARHNFEGWAAAPRLAASSSALTKSRKVIVINDVPLPMSRGAPPRRREGIFTSILDRMLVPSRRQSPGGLKNSRGSSDVEVQRLEVGPARQGRDRAGRGPRWCCPGRCATASPRAAAFAFPSSTPARCSSCSSSSSPKIDEVAAPSAGSPVAADPASTARGIYGGCGCNIPRIRLRGLRQGSQGEKPERRPRLARTKVRSPRPRRSRRGRGRDRPSR